MGDALQQSRAREERADAVRVRDAALDPSLVEQFVTACEDGALEQRVLRDLLKARGRWYEVTAPAWTERQIATHTNKRFYIGDPNYVGQESIGRQMGRRAGLSELVDLIALFADLEVTVAKDPHAGVMSALAELRTDRHVPGLIVCPLSWQLLQQLGVGLRADVGALDGTDVPSTHHDKFNGALEGVPVIDHPNLVDRILVIDLAAVRMEEMSTPDGSGVRAAVTAFDPDRARQFVAKHPGLVSDEKSEDQVVEELQGQVRLELNIAWYVSLEDSGLARAINVPEEFRRH